METEPIQVFYVPGKLYSITICPEEQYTAFNQIGLRYERYVDKVRKVLSMMEGIDYVLWTEISEPLKLTPSGSKMTRLHMHGIIQINSVQQWLLKDINVLYSRLGIVDLDTIDNVPLWIKYCKKQQPYLNFKPFWSSKGFVKSLKKYI